jgi:hypothetical protein
VAGGGSGAHPSRWRAGVAVALPAAALGGVYYTTLLPGVGYSPDSAEMQFAGRFLCVTHPTGYPAYLLSSHAFSRFFPFGSIAFRANLLSALFAVLACLVLRRLLLRLGAGATAASAAALAFGLTPTFWRYAVVAEVYALHVLLVVLVADRFLAWRRSHRRRDLVLACALYAFAFGNHLTMVTLLPALAFLVLATRARVVREWRTVLPVAALTALAALQYAYPLWRSADPATPYLASSVHSLSELLAYATGAEFRGAMFAFGPAQLLRSRLPLYWRQLWHDCGPLLPLAVVGVVRLRDRVAAAFLELVFLGSLGFALEYGIDDIDAYFLPSFLVTAAFAGIGLSALLSWRPLSRLAPALALVLPLALGAAHWSAVQVQEGPEKADFARQVLKVARGRALVVTGYNDYMYLLSLVLGEGRGGPWLFAGYQVSAPEIAAYLVRQRPVWLPSTRQRVPPGLPVYCSRLELRPALRAAGLGIRAVRPGIYQVVGPPQERPPGL